jgi:peptidoglycan/LPS O-acetylase OafA/YrhL
MDSFAPASSGSLAGLAADPTPTAASEANVVPVRSEAPVKLAFIPGLDGLRGLAVLLVISLHVQPSLMQSGFIGVNLFFVLSGFLITSLLLREWALRGGINLGRFYLRRALRLLPALFLLLAACIAFVYFTGTRTEFSHALVDARAILFYYYNWHLALHPGQSFAPTFYHLWSLSVEEQFYLVWPVLLLVALSLGLRRDLLLLLIAAGIAVISVHRPLGILFIGNTNFWMSTRTDYCADALLWGAGVAILLDGWTGTIAPALRRALRFALPAALAVFLWHARLDPLESRWWYWAGYPLVDLSAAVLIVSTVCNPPAWWRRASEFAPLRWTGRISYSLYLWHFVLIVVLVYVPVTIVTGMLVWQRSVIAVVAAFAIAASSHYGLEQPILQWRDRGARGAAAPSANPVTIAAAPLVSPLTVPGATLGSRALSPLPAGSAGSAASQPRRRDGPRRSARRQVRIDPRHLGG